MTEYDTIDEARNAEKPWRDEGLMRELYHDKLMSQDEIADHFDNKITQAGVGYCLDQLGIEKRDRSEAAKLRWQKLRDSVHLRRLADRYLSGDYTIQETTFTDGDSRTKLIHSYGWSPENYLQEILWVGRREIWLEYYEDDIRRLRETFSMEEYPGYGEWTFD